jgi:hypothetical protein
LPIGTHVFPADKYRRVHAALLGITEGSIRHREQVPAHQIIKIEKLTGVPRERLRPGLYRK